MILGDQRIVDVVDEADAERVADDVLDVRGDRAEPGGRRRQRVQVVLERGADLLTGRGVETIPRGGEAAEAVADLVRPGSSAAELSSAIDAARARIATTFDAVAARGTIDALADPRR